MSRRPASFTQADVARVLRAAKQVGAVSVVVKVGDTEVIVGLDAKPLDEPATVKLW
jgi:serine acetyltransferase